MSAKRGDSFLHHRIHTRYAELARWEAFVLKLVAKAYKLAVVSIVPVAAAGLAYALLTNRAPRALVVWSASEVLFFLLSKKLAQMTILRRPLVREEGGGIPASGRVVENEANMRRVLVRWQLERPMELFQEHFTGWVAWMVLEKQLQHLTVHEHALLSKALPSIAFQFRKSPTALHAAPNGMRPSLDALPRQPKPLLSHAWIKAMHAAAYVALRWLGFRRESTLGLSYWHSPGDSTDPPVVFIHGLGVGLFPYLEKIRRLQRHNSRRRIFLVELPHVSMSIYHHILDRDQTLHAFDSLFLRHALDKITLVAHSYGTVLASWLVQKRQHLLSNVTLLDPICFNMWESTLAYNFLYAEPFCFTHELATFFVARDPLICHTITSELHWHESVLFPQDVHVPTHVFLSAHDWVIDAVACAKYLRATLPPCGSVHLLDTSHGGFLALPSLYSRVFDTI